MNLVTLPLATPAQLPPYVASTIRMAFVGFFSSAVTLPTEEQRIIKATPPNANRWWCIDAPPSVVKWVSAVHDVHRPSSWPIHLHLRFVAGASASVERMVSGIDAKKWRRSSRRRKRKALLRRPMGLQGHRVSSSSLSPASPSGRGRLVHHLAISQSSASKSDCEHNHGTVPPCAVRMYT